MSTTQIIKTLEKIIADYIDTYLIAITVPSKDDQLYELEKVNIGFGVCHFMDYAGLRLPKYIIRRNTTDGVYWYKTPIEAFLDREDILKSIEMRVVILKRELDHHKKWGFLAMFFKPKPKQHATPFIASSFR